MFFPRHNQYKYHNVQSFNLFLQSLHNFSGYATFCYKTKDNQTEGFLQYKYSTDLCAADTMYMGMKEQKK